MADQPSPKASPPSAKKRGPGPRFFLRGLIVVLPAVFTVFILVTAYRFVDQYVSGPVNAVIYWGLEGNSLGWGALRSMDIDPHADEYLMPSALSLELQDKLRENGSTDPEFRASLENWRGEHKGLFIDLEEQAIQATRLRRDVTERVPRVIGLFVSILLVISLGSVAGGFIGSRFVGRMERALHVIPIVRSIYPYTKQLVDFFLADRKMEFKSVVAVEYPRKGLWSTAFVTSSGLKTLHERTGEALVSMFIPSSPMPMTGYTIFARADTLIPLPFTVDEALRVIVSGGVLVPPHEQVPDDSLRALAEASEAFSKASEDGEREQESK